MSLARVNPYTTLGQEASILAQQLKAIKKDLLNDKVIFEVGKYAFSSQHPVILDIVSKIATIIHDPTNADQSNDLSQQRLEELYVHIHDTKKNQSDYATLSLPEQNFIEALFNFYKVLFSIKADLDNIAKFELTNKEYVALNKQRLALQQSREKARAKISEVKNRISFLHAQIANGTIINNNNYSLLRSLNDTEMELKKAHASYEQALRNYNFYIKNGEYNKFLTNLKRNVSDLKSRFEGIRSDGLFRVDVNETVIQPIYFGLSSTSVTQKKTIEFMEQAKINGVLNEFYTPFSKFLSRIENLDIGAEQDVLSRVTMFDFVQSEQHSVRSELTDIALLQNQLGSIFEENGINIQAKADAEAKSEAEAQARAEIQTKAEAKAQVRAEASAQVTDTSLGISALPTEHKPIQQSAVKKPGFLRRHWLSLTAATTIGGLTGAGIGFALGWFFAPATLGLSVPILAGIGAAAGACIGVIAGLVTSFVACKVYDHFKNKQSPDAPQGRSYTDLNRALSQPTRQSTLSNKYHASCDGIGSALADSVLLSKNPATLYGNSGHQPHKTHSDETNSSALQRQEVFHRP